MSISRGHQSEYLVETVFRERGAKILARRWRTPFAELDLVVRLPTSDVVILEVKSSDWPAGEMSGLSLSQRRRLLRAREWLQGEWGEVIQIWTAVLDARRKVRILDFD